MPKSAGITDTCKGMFWPVSTPIGGRYPRGAGVLEGMHQRALLRRSGRC